jgi:hypothetical protein
MPCRYASIAGAPPNLHTIHSGSMTMNPGATLVGNIVEIEARTPGRELWRARSRTGVTFRSWATHSIFRSKVTLRRMAGAGGSRCRRNRLRQCIQQVCSDNCVSRRTRMLFRRCYSAKCRRVQLFQALGRREPIQKVHQNRSLWVLNCLQEQRMHNDVAQCVISIAELWQRGEGHHLER